MLNRLETWMFDWAVYQAGIKIEKLLPIRKRPEDVLIAICDHFEPTWTGDPNHPGQASKTRALARVIAWRKRYPIFAANWHDSSGVPPRHTFFYPGDQYAFEFVEPLAQLVEMGLADVEVHLHHDGDTRRTLEEKFVCTLDNLNQHAIVPHVREKPRWAFIHGNWCLANGRKDGRHCGVDDEIDLLHKLGCYADFTFPSAPDPTQPRIVNRIYYPRGDMRRRRAHERGQSARIGEKNVDRILCVQGPLCVCPRRGPGLPWRIDSGALTARDPATIDRFEHWVAQGISIRGRSDWIFVKLSTHGAPEREAASLLGFPQQSFHEGLSNWSKRTGIRYHYVTAREMFNIARAAMDGKTGSPHSYRDYEIPPAARVRCH